MTPDPEPLVSVHMITYNHRPYIERSINGVLEQKTDFPIELVIGEDCSTDGTREVVQQYAERHPDVIRTVMRDANVGVKANSRSVYAATRGKYIAYCEGDDYWHDPDKLQIQVDFLEANPDYVMVYTNLDWYVVLEDRRLTAILGDQPAYQGMELAIRLLAHELWINTPTVLARRDLVLRIREENPYEFSETFLMGDKQTWMELGLRGKIHYINRSTATMNRLPESVTESRFPERRIAYSLNSLKLREHYIAKLGITGPMRTKIVREVCLPMLVWAWEIGDAETAGAVVGALRAHGYRLRVLDRLYVAGARSAARRKATTPLIRACLKGGEMGRRVKAG